MSNSSSIRTASALKFLGRFVLHSCEQTSPVITNACEPYIHLPSEAGKDDIGRAVLMVLAGFRVSLPQAIDMPEVTGAFIKNVGAKSNRQFQANSICCLIDETKEGIHFIPSHNGGTRGDSKGFQHLPEAAISLPPHSAPSELGAALLQAFSLCTSIYTLAKDQPMSASSKRKTRLRQGDIRCFSCGGVIHPDETSCSTCGWTWK